MRKYFLAAGIAAAALIPTLASAQPSCGQQRDNRAAGTVIGAGVGALAGAAIAGPRDTGIGVIVGGLAGAVVGNQVTRPTADCAHAYGYYDSNGLWHANDVPRGYATGYYDRSGAWIDGAPNGYYDRQGRWIAASTAASSGYYDRAGRWVPASAAGYYDTSGQWVAGTASGHYDVGGRWIPGAAIGRYDDHGRWIAGQPAGHRDVRGVSLADAQPGYYNDSGRWVVGSTSGYYDDQGHWIATAPSAMARGSDAAYAGRHSDWGDARNDVRAHEAWLEHRIQGELRDGTLSRTEANQALQPLASIRQQEMSRRGDDGRLSPRDEAYFLAQLDNLNASTH